MQLVLLTALGVGGATVIGAIAGFLIKDISHRFSDLVLAFAAGVVLAAAVLGLILPSVDYGNVFITVAGIFAGAVCLNLADRLVPRLADFAAAVAVVSPAASGRSGAGERGGAVSADQYSAQPVGAEAGALTD